jgi:hypothetical protein
VSIELTSKQPLPKRKKEEDGEKEQEEEKVALTIERP